MKLLNAFFIGIAVGLWYDEQRDAAFDRAFSRGFHKGFVDTVRKSE